MKKMEQGTLMLIITNRCNLAMGIHWKNYQLTKSFKKKDKSISNVEMVWEIHKNVIVLYKNQLEIWRHFHMEYVFYTVTWRDFADFGAVSDCRIH